MEAGTPGKPFMTKGSPSHLWYKYVNFWVDRRSSFVYITFHSSKEAPELVKSKQEFEIWSTKFGMKIKNIRADNDVYSVKLFRDACTKDQQTLTFCAVGAHWQNGVAKRFVGMITERTCRILLHAIAKWPDTITEDMWTYALRHVVNFHNASFHKDQRASSYQLYTGQEAPWSLRDFKVFGCPSYVLDKALQDGKSLNKWKFRSWKGVYIGNSTCHSSFIPLIYNPATTHITPQYHVIFDEHFKSGTGDINSIHGDFFESFSTPPPTGCTKILLVTTHIPSIVFGMHQ